MKEAVNISVHFFDNHKTLKLMSRLGFDSGVKDLLTLWRYTAMNRPDGVLGNMDDEDVEIAARWEGEPGAFVAALLEAGFLDRRKDGCLVVHDWEEYNGHAAHARERSGRTRYATVNLRKDIHSRRKQCKAQPSPCSSQCSVHPGAMRPASPSNAPSPDPVPDPVPSPKNNNYPQLLALLPVAERFKPAVRSTVRQWLRVAGFDHLRRNILYAKLHCRRNYPAYLAKAIEGDYAGVAAANAEAIERINRGRQLARTAQEH